MFKRLRHIVPFLGQCRLLTCSGSRFYTHRLALFYIRSMGGMSDENDDHGIAVTLALLRKFVNIREIWDLPFLLEALRNSWTWHIIVTWGTKMSSLYLDLSPKWNGVYYGIDASLQIMMLPPGHRSNLSMPQEA